MFLSVPTNIQAVKNVVYMIRKNMCLYIGYTVHNCHSFSDKTFCLIDKLYGEVVKIRSQTNILKYSINNTYKIQTL